MPTPHDDTFDLPPGYEPSDSSRKNDASDRALTVAMLSSDADVDMPSGRHPASVVSNLIALSVGENYTKSLRVDDSATLAEVQENLNDWKYRLRQSVNQAVRRAREHDRRVLTMETSHTITPSGRVYVQIIVTRTE